MALPYASPTPTLPSVEKEQRNEADQHQQTLQDETAEAPPKPARSSQMFTATDEEWAESEREQQPRAEPVKVLQLPSELHSAAAARGRLRQDQHPQRPEVIMEEEVLVFKY